MAKSKKVRMPIGMRNKLMAAVSMLLVSSIMMVSTTFAWFTLSTAPEVTGITTSVGANGNLEMALLDTTTYGALDTIASAVGNSSQATGSVTASNITWGNLVDLADASYGLQTISLMPSRLNFLSTTSEAGTVYDTTKIGAVANLLKTPTYGKDGRVNDVGGITYASVYENGSWKYVAGHPTYGVRAIGTNDNLTPQQAGLIAAKAAYNTNLASAKSTIQTALSANGSNLASAITTLAMNSAGATITSDQERAISAMVTASSTALNYIDAAYKQVLLAAVSNLDATPYAAAVAAINGAADYNAAVTALSTLAGGAVNAPTFMTTAASNLATQKTAVSNASDLLATDMKGALSKLVDTSKVTVNGYKVGTPQDGNYDGYLMGVDGKINSTFMNAVLNAGGAIVEMPDGSGVFAYVGSVAGNYSAGCKVTIDYKGLVLNDMNATMKTTATVDTTIGNALKGITANASGDGTTALSDTYGYALDFAFRTNATSSYLQLQTAGKQRVYSDSDSVATQGGGSTMTFKAATTDAGTSVLTDAQVKSLMGAIRVAFIDPAQGTIYGIASLDNIVPGGDGFKGELMLRDYTIDSNGVMKLATNPEGQIVAKADKPDTADKNEAIALMKLDQNTPVRLTAVVWLDGDQVDNGDVANAAQSLIGSMNLQFSSSATLQPMQNTALHNMTITYTAETGDLADNGFYQYQGSLYKLNAGYKVYKGSDNMIYFSNDETNYTKLTEMSLADAMSPVSASIYFADNNAVIDVGQSKELVDALVLNGSANISIQSVSYASRNGEIATVTAGGTVTGRAAGKATIAANVTAKIGDTATTVTFYPEYNITVNAVDAGT